MNKLKESNTAWYKPTGGWTLWFVEVFVGVVVMALWSPIAGLLGITQPWVSIIFIVGWVVFWMSPQGPKARMILERMIRREV